MSSISELLQNVQKWTDRTLESLKEVNELDMCCKAVLEKYLSNPETINDSAAIKIQAIIDYMYEQVNIGNWKEVKIFLRKTITILSYLKLLAHIKCSEDLTEDVVKESYKIIDYGLLFGCPLDIEPKLLQQCAALFSCSIVPAKLSNIREDSHSSEVLTSQNKYNAIPIPSLDCPSMEHFYKHHILTETPVVLKNCNNHWPALTKWKDQNYFLKLAGHRTVSIELGSQYTDTEWTQKLMTIEEFIKHHIYQRDGPTGYLAQYQLFDQIPELKEDISEPEYCCFSDTNNPVDVMAWFGPKGTISPLHHDPKRNLLTQVVGEKQVFLFSPLDSSCLYPHEHELLNNTAKVDPREPDLEKYPKYKDAKPSYCLLQPGDMLYIPPKWWHFVESLAISFSVSFWWE